MKLEIKNVTKKYKDKTAVSNFSLELQTGDCVGLIGPNGAGKSTLIKMIADIIDPSDGEVVLNGKKISSMKEYIGYLPQYPDFYPWMTAEETLLFMGQLSGLHKEVIVQDIPPLLEMVGLNSAGNKRVGFFSGGMKQRLGIAQALLHKPPLIIMDEPVSALDPIGRREVLNIIQRIKSETTILLSTHILGDAQEICERFVIIKDGIKVEDVTKNDLIDKHSKNKIIMEIKSDNSRWMNVVRKLDYVKSVKVIGTKLVIEVEDVHRCKHMLLRNSLDHNIDLLYFGIEKESLEEIFINLVV